MRHGTGNIADLVPCSGSGLLDRLGLVLQGAGAIVQRGGCPANIVNKLAKPGDQSVYGGSHTGYFIPSGNLGGLAKIRICFHLPQYLLGEAQAKNHRMSQPQRHTEHHQQEQQRTHQKVAPLALHKRKQAGSTVFDGVTAMQLLLTDGCQQRLYRRHQLEVHHLTNLVVGSVMDALSYRT